MTTLLCARRRTLAISLLLTLCAPCAHVMAQTSGAPVIPETTATAAPATAAPVTADTWPRIFNSGGFTVTVYPPNLNSWDTSTLVGTCAFSRSAGDGSALTYGTFSFTASTEVNRINRMVTLTNVTITAVSLPDSPQQQTAMQTAMQTMAATRNANAALTVPLDRLEAAVPTMSTSPHVTVAALRNVAPAITVASTPTVLVPVQGTPAFAPIAGTKLYRVINTQMLLVRDAKNVWWLKIADGWMSAPSIDGPWTVGASTSNADLAAAVKWATTNPAVNLLSGAQPAPAPAPSLTSGAPAIIVSTKPAEVIVTEGPPKWEALGTSGVDYVTNTGGNIFRLTSRGVNYVLVSGRWFTAATLAGPWTFVPAASMPTEFHAIPQESPKENVLASIPGTAQAQEAAIANAIPQMARVPRSQVLVNPTIVGAKPVTAAIVGTSLHVVTNSTVPMFMVTQHEWYALKDGVWFTATSITGPWTLASWVSSEIYRIPPSSQYYYVTFVRIYGSTSDYVLVGYTPGYYGAYEQDGVIVYGTGYIYDPYCTDVWIAAPDTYGYAVNPAYSPWMGWGMGYAMGMSMSDTYYYNSYPYWGPYSAAYGPGGWAATTGNVYRQSGDISSVTRTSEGYNAWTGNAWGATSGAAYNSTTGARAAGQKGYVDNAYTGNWAEGERGAGYNPETGTYAAGKAGAVGTDGDTKAVAAAGTVGNTTTGNEVSAAGVKTENGTWGVAHGDNGTAVATPNNVYATSDGQVYRDQNGTWENHSNGSWNTVNDANTTSQLNQQKATRADGDWRSSMATGSSGNSWAGNNGANNNRSNANQGNANQGNANRNSANSGRFGRASGGGGFGGGGRRR